VLTNPIQASAYLPGAFHIWPYLLPMTTQCG
jgi:hypothetical protein